MRQTATLDKSNQEERIAEAKNDKIRYLEEVNSAQRKVTDLQTHLKVLESKLSEKDTEIRLLQEKKGNQSQGSHFLDTPVTHNFAFLFFICSRMWFLLRLVQQLRFESARIQLASLVQRVQPVVQYQQHHQHRVLAAARPSHAAGLRQELQSKCEHRLQRKCGSRDHVDTAWKRRHAAQLYDQQSVFGLVVGGRRHFVRQSGVGAGGQRTTKLAG